MTSKGEFHSTGRERDRLQTLRPSKFTSTAVIALTESEETRAADHCINSVCSIFNASETGYLSKTGQTTILKYLSVYSSVLSLQYLTELRDTEKFEAHGVEEATM
jgi:hypothetical protein